MRNLTCSLATLLLALICCQIFAGEDAKKLQGSWDLTELIIGGMKVPDKDIQGMKFVFSSEKDEHKLTILPPPSDTPVVDKRTFTVKIDPTKKPATVNLVALDGEFKGTASPGIFEIKGDVLRWCQSDDPKATERPKEFKSPENSKIYLFTFKRSK